MNMMLHESYMVINESMMINVIYQWW